MEAKGGRGEAKIRVSTTTWNTEKPTKVTQKPIPNQRRCVSISIVPPGASSFDLFPSHSLEAHVNLHAGEPFPLL